KAPIFSSPLGLYDISPLSDGSASLILSVTQKSEFRVKGLGHGISRFFNPPYSLSFEASIKAFIQAYNNSNIKPSDIDIAELHDAFTIFEAIGMEDGGLAEKGKALDIIKSGITHSSGSLPINASGGLKSRGHPIGASGLAQIVEIQTHMKKLNKHIGLTHSIGGLATNNFVTIIEYAT
ncbi:MAG: thiolase family protein, partial [Spirochaetia bacterium]|nr:thiolase family protein [Spirochaetia bacterium]